MISGEANQVRGCYIGTDASGEGKVANDRGVELTNGAMYNLIGGVDPAAHNVISGNTSHGIYLYYNSPSNEVKGNYLGVDAAGAADLGNGGNGVELDSDWNTIGGTTAGERNVLSGDYCGIIIQGNHNKITGNHIGTDKNGLNAVANVYDGVFAVSGTYNIIGGTAAGEGNVISGNTWEGVWLANSGTNSNEVLGNLIGTKSNGNEALPNYRGVTIQDGPAFNLIGGTAAGAGNVISGNRSDGVFILKLSSSNSNSNEVQGNIIGLNQAGNAKLANGGSGIHLNGAFYDVIGTSETGGRNIISGNNYYGIFIDSTNEANAHNIVKGNYIGTDITGLTALGNSWEGVYINSSAYNMIGGATAGEGNLISGNSRTGLVIYGNLSDSNEVYGNIVGLNQAGNSELGNGVGGILVSSAGVPGPGYTIIGGSGEAANLVSGNNGNGISVSFSGGGLLHSRVVGNLIGTDATGTVAIGNHGIGLDISQAEYCYIGGVTSAEGNVIGGNDSAGLYIVGMDAFSCEVYSNFIGTDRSGTLNLGNRGDGVSITGQVKYTQLGPKNIIAFNGAAGGVNDYGIEIEQAYTIPDTMYGNTITRNSMYQNNGLGIILEGGANASIEAPVIRYADYRPDVGGGITIMAGTGETSTLNELFITEVPPHPSGYGEGQTYHSTFETDAPGKFRYTEFGTTLSGATVCATATDVIGNTSQFSLNKPVNGANPTAAGLVLRDRVTGSTAYTNNRDISLEVVNYSDDSYEMSMSENPGFAGAGWTDIQLPTTFELSAADGAKTVYFKVRDIVSLESTPINASIILDTQPPLVAGVILRDRTTGSSLETNQLTVTVEAVGVSADADSMRLAQDSGFTVNSTGWVPYAAFSEYTFTPGDGPRTAYLQVRDHATNESAAAAGSIIINSAVPTCSAISLSDTRSGSTVYSASLTVSLEALGVVGSPVSMRLAGNNSFNGSGNDTGWIGFVNPTEFTLTTGDGTREIYYKMRNSASTESVVFSSSIIIDTIPPVVTVVAPNGGEIMSGLGGLYNVRWSATDNIGLAPAPINLRFSADSGASWSLIAAGQPNSPPYVWSVPAVNSLLCRISVEAVDLAGNRGSARSAADFIIDSLPPTVPVLVAPTNASSTTESAQLLKWLPSTNNLTGVASYEIKLDSQTITLGVTTELPATLNYGLHTWEARARDGAGNWSAFSSPWTFWVRPMEHEPPVITISSGGSVLANGDYITSRPTFEISVTDNFALDTASVRMTLDGNSVTPTVISSSVASMELTYQPPTDLEDETVKTHAVRVDALDLAGNPGSKEVTGLKVSHGETRVVGPVLIYPTPYNPPRGPAKIVYTLNREAKVDIMIFGPTGDVQWLRKFNAGQNGGHAGYNEVEFNGVSDISGVTLANAIYLVRIVADGKAIGKAYIVISE